jgi:ribose 5-phosphate isomerase A
MSDALVELGKKSAAYRAVEENVQNGMILGIGSGSTVVYAIEKLKKLISEKKMSVKCIPTSFQSYQLIVENGLNLGSLDQYPNIDLDLDGADEIDEDLNLIKGGGGCLVQEKIVASNSKRLIIIADFRKKSKKLGENWKKGVPIEVIPLAYVPIIEKLKKLGGNPKLRMAQAKAGPLITDNGNFIIDADFGIIKSPNEINEVILKIPGVVDTGLFVGMTEKAYIGQKDGTVLVLE